MRNTRLIQETWSILLYYVFRKNLGAFVVGNLLKIKNRKKQELPIFKKNKTFLNKITLHVAKLTLKWLKVGSTLGEKWQFISFLTA